MVSPCLSGGGGLGGNFAYAAWMVGSTSSVLQFQRQLQHQLLLLDQSLGAAAAEHVKSGQEQGVAQEFGEKSSLDREESARLEERAAGLRARANEQAASASAMEGEADQVEKGAVELQGEAAEQLSVAAVEEGASQRATALGVEQGEAALAKAMRAHVEEMGVALCQAAPGLDVLCDVLGGAAAVGMEAAAAAQSTEAVVDFAAAAAAKESEEAELARAADLEAEAAAEQVTADAERGEASTLTEEAAAERADADADQARAEALMQQSATEEEEAAAASEQSAQDEATAVKLGQQAAQHGVLAIGYAILQTAMAGATIVYAGLRFIVTLVLFTVSSVARGGHDEGSVTIPRPAFWVSLLSGGAHSLALLYFVATVLGSPSIDGAGSKQAGLDLEEYWRRQGGIILLVSIAATALQALVLHSVRYRTMFLHDSWTGGTLTLRVMAETALFWLWNLLAVVWWLRLGSAAAPDRWTCLRHPLLPLSRLALALILCATITLHHVHWLSAHNRLTARRPSESARATETTSLLPAGDDLTVGPAKEVAPRSVWTVQHQLALDLWFACALTGLIVGIAGRTAVLHPFWPQAKGVAIAWADRNKWRILSAAIVFAVLVGAAFAALSLLRPSVVPSCRRRSRRVRADLER